jgi:hypothetical protein
MTSPWHMMPVHNISKILLRKIFNRDKDFDRK